MFDTTLDHELTYYKCQFLQEDFSNIVDIAMKLVLTPKQIFDSEVDPSDGFELPEPRLLSFCLNQPSGSNSWVIAPPKGSFLR
jgi:processing peptidase subunit alpha